MGRSGTAKTRPVRMAATMAPRAISQAVAVALANDGKGMANGEAMVAKA